MRWVRKHPGAFSFLLVFYLAANLGMSSTAIRSWLLARATGVEIPPCGCLDPDCRCGAPCCSPEARRLRATAAGREAPSIQTASPDCCATLTGGNNHSCCEVNDYQEMVLRSACMCGNARLNLGIITGDNHVFPDSLPRPLDPPSSRAPRAPIPAPCWASADPPDKVPKA